MHRVPVTGPPEGLCLSFGLLENVGYHQSAGCMLLKATSMRGPPPREMARAGSSEKGCGRSGHDWGDSWPDLSKRNKSAVASDVESRGQFIDPASPMCGSPRERWLWDSRS